jgi:8-oxo-dGTP pyrophosphatase MutT (NUDIX family)
MEKLKDYSFGIIPIYKQNEEENRFLIIEGKNGKAWGFPKGHTEGDENEIETARRELFEETGIKNVQLIEGLRYAENYDIVRKGVSVSKTAVFYAGFVQNNNVVVQEDEISNFKWATYEEALNTFLHENPKRILVKLVSDLKRLENSSDWIPASAGMTEGAE